MLLGGRWLSVRQEGCQKIVVGGGLGDEEGSLISIVAPMAEECIVAAEVSAVIVQRLWNLWELLGRKKLFVLIIRKRIGFDEEAKKN